MSTFDLIISNGMLGRALKRRIWNAATLSGLRAPGSAPVLFADGEALKWVDSRGFGHSTELPVRGEDVARRFREAKVLRFWVCGGKVGGMFSNVEAGHEYLRDNLLYQLAAMQLIETAVRAPSMAGKSAQVVWFGSTCQLPQNPHGLVAASALDVGYAGLHPSNRGYAWAKNTALVMLNEFVTAQNRAAERQVVSGFFMLPTNLLGPDDSGLRPENAKSAHAVPGMIDRYFEVGHITGHPGGGSERRDFSTAIYAAACAEKYVEDLARSVGPENTHTTAAGRHLVDGNVHLYNLPPEFPGVRLEEIDRLIAQALGVAQRGFSCYTTYNSPRTKPVVVSPDAPHAPCSDQRLDRVIADMVAAAKRHRGIA